MPCRHSPSIGRGNELSTNKGKSGIEEMNSRQGCVHTRFAKENLILALEDWQRKG